MKEKKLELKELGEDSNYITDFGSIKLVGVQA